MENITNKQQSLSITHPEIVQHWDNDKNKNYTPEDVFAESHKRIYWLCEQGHEEFEPVRVRVRRGGCVECIRKAKKELVPPSMKMGNTFYHFQKEESISLKDFFALEDIPNTPIEEIILKERGTNRIRIYNVLRRYDIETLDVLLDCTYDQIGRFRNLGDKSQKDLFDILEEYINRSLDEYKRKMQ
jgi:DNA-directed RNA polymerase alpha subunit